MSDTHVITGISLLSIFIGAIIASQLTRDRMRQEAIEHGAAHYDAKTAEFTWNNERANP